MGHIIKCKCGYIINGLSKAHGEGLYKQHLSGNKHKKTMKILHEHRRSSGRSKRFCQV